MTYAAKCKKAAEQGMGRDNKTKVDNRKIKGERMDSMELSETVCGGCSFFAPQMLLFKWTSASHT